jgi:hypothetical protein
MFVLRCKCGETGLYLLVISRNVYWSSIHENKARASDSVIHPRSPTCKALSDADNASSSTALVAHFGCCVQISQQVAGD